MDYGKLFARAWDIVWNHKFMFVLGFLAALGSGGNRSSSNFNYRTSGPVSPGFAAEVEQFFTRFGPVLIGLVCFGMILALVFWLVRLVAQAGLISAASRVDAGEKVTFSEAFSAGTGKLGRMVGVNVLMYGPFTLLGLVALGVFVVTFGTAVFGEMGAFRELQMAPGDMEAIFSGLGILGFFFVCLACLMLPLLLVVTAVYPFAQRGAVLQDLGVVASIRHGWQIVKENIGDVVLLIIFFIVIGFIFGIVMLIVLIPFAFLALGPTALAMLSRGAPEAIDFLLLAGGMICLGVVAAAVNSILIAFRSTAVTLAYQEFIGKMAKLELQ